MTNMTLVDILYYLDGHTQQYREKKLAEWGISKCLWKHIEASFQGTHLVDAKGHRVQIG